MARHLSQTRDQLRSASGDSQRRSSIGLFNDQFPCDFQYVLALTRYKFVARGMQRLTAALHITPRRGHGADGYAHLSAPCAPDGGGALCSGWPLCSIHCSPALGNGPWLTASRRSWPRWPHDPGRRGRGVRPGACHHACGAHASHLALRTSHVALPYVCENQDFCTQMNMLILLGFLCAKDTCIMGV